jgi:hypothetical protein
MAQCGKLVSDNNIYGCQRVLQISQDWRYWFHVKCPRFYSLAMKSPIRRLISCNGLQKVKVKLSLYQAVEAQRVVRRQGSHIF